MPCPDKFIWDEPSIYKFQSAISSDIITSIVKNFQDMNYNTCESPVDTAVSYLNSIFAETAKWSLKKKERNKKKRKSHQKWYVNSRQDMCSIIDHYSRLLSFDDPFNREFRQKCFILNTRYNKERRKNKRNYFQLIMNKLDNLEESNPRMFWKLINSLKPDTKNVDDFIDIKTCQDHFKSLNTLPECKQELAMKFQRSLDNLILSNETTLNEVLDKPIYDKDIFYLYVRN